MSPVLFLVGPTGSGKTQLSLSLARRIGCEIISADSMLVYRGMNIGTAKPTFAERKKIRHHLINVISPRSPFSVARHRELALSAIKSIHKRGKVPLVVGGSGFYVNAIWKGLSPHPPENPELRTRLARLAGKRGLAFLYEKLKRIDPQHASQIHPNDGRRIFRALEIAGLSGKSPTRFYGEKTSLEDLGYAVKAFGILRDRPDLYQRINRRVEQMFRQGFFQEVIKLKRKGFSETARQALGYREILNYLQKGGKKVTDELIGEIQQKTRQFAKRQLTWFRREKGIRWIPWDVGETPIAVRDKIMKEVKNG